MSYKAFVPVLALFISCLPASLEQEASTETPQVVQASALEIEEAELKANTAGLDDMMESCRGLDPDLVSDSLRQSCIYLLMTALRREHISLARHPRLMPSMRVLKKCQERRRNSSIDAPCSCSGGWHQPWPTALMHRPRRCLTAATRSARAAGALDASADSGPARYAPNVPPQNLRYQSLDCHKKKSPSIDSVMCYAVTIAWVELTADVLPSKSQQRMHLPRRHPLNTISIIANTMPAPNPWKMNRLPAAPVCPPAIFKARGRYRKACYRHDQPSATSIYQGLSPGFSSVVINANASHKPVDHWHISLCTSCRSVTSDNG